MSRLLKSLLIAAPLCVGAGVAQSAPNDYPADTQPMYSQPPGSAPPAYAPAPAYQPAPAPEPSAKQKIKNGAHQFKSDAKATKQDIKSGSKEAWHDVKSGTRHAWNSTKEGAHEAKAKIKHAFKGDEDTSYREPAPVTERSYNSASVDAPR
ncbi:MAG TPA: hypothetical protein VH105_23420 [Burkholderiales bacterium]|jgi:hypothetical protein|nr:hypothetical protein [Burkholderiales bacterium]